jgi:hypothetical protein
MQFMSNKKEPLHYRTINLLQDLVESLDDYGYSIISQKSNGDVVAKTLEGNKIKLSLNNYDNATTITIRYDK